MKKTVSKGFWLGMLAMMVPVFGMTFLGCATGRPPATFQRGAGGETAILLRSDMEFEHAFRELIFILNRHNFNPVMVQPEAGFVRTGWNYQWFSVPGQGGVDRYRVRIIAQFNPGRTQLIINPEGEWFENGMWIRGWDTRAVETLRNDITMAIGN